MKTSPRPNDADEVNAYHRDGFAVMRGLFAIEEIQPLQIACREDPTIRGSVVKLADSVGGAQELTCWTHLGEDLLGVFPRLERVIRWAELFLGEEVYHWHSKLSLKPPHSSGRWDWHQDYPYWYNEGCLYPSMLTCTIAVEDTFVLNGCLQVLRGSHSLQRIDHVKVGLTTACDPTRLEEARKRHELVNCEMKAGDVLFFHGNLLHASGANDSDQPRTLLHCTYNTLSNQPILEESRNKHPATPIERLSDDTILNRNFGSAFDNHIFPKRSQQQGTSRYGQTIL